jgi:regulator of cell morphogenesis and NO signaling
MNQLLSKTLAQIVNEDNRTAIVFEKYQLDFCCKGKRTLEQACRESSVPENEILDQLSLLEVTPQGQVDDVETFSASELARYIVARHHSYTKKELPRIMSYLLKISSSHGDRHPEMIKVAALFAELCEEMELHMQKEEVILFPRIQKLQKQKELGLLDRSDIIYLKSPILMMEAEHDHAGNIMSQIRKLTNNYTAPKNTCTTFQLALSALEIFEIDLHRHVHLENNLLFPKAIKILTDRS